MPRAVFVYRDGQMVPKSEARPLNASANVIRDQMDPTIHHATGELIDSKSKFRQITKAAGCIEVGNEKVSPPARPPPDLKDAAGRAYQMVRDGYRPGTIFRKDWDG